MQKHWVIVVEEVRECFILHLIQLGLPSCCKKQLFPWIFASVVSNPRALQLVPACGTVFVWVWMLQELGRVYFCLPDNKPSSLLYARKTDEEWGQPG